MRPPPPIATRVVGSGKIPRGLPRPTDTSARHVVSLAAASLLLSRRRCLVARMTVPSTPSPYSLQGMSEKIHFQSFIRQQSLELEDLLAQDYLARPPGRGIGLFHSGAPLIEHSPGYSELPSEPDDVAAGVHPFNSLSAKLTTVSLTFSSFHFAAPFPQSVPCESGSS